VTQNPAVVTSENPHGYCCRKCGRSREYAERWCSSAYCAERRRAEDLERECPIEGYTRFRMFEGPV
jgi:hypothetical protein